LQKINRSICAITGKNDLEILYTFKKFPVFMGCVTSSPRFDLNEDMSWAISKSSGLIQLQQLLPLDILYAEQHGAGAVGALWLQHHAEFAKFISQYSPDAVLEIGGGHGILAKEYSQLKKIPWVIVEPNPSPVKDCPAEFFKGFFDEKFEHALKFNALVHSHVLEHIYEPNLFMEHLSCFMNVGDHLIFSLPNMEEMLRRKYNNCINFEHTLFLTEPYIEYLLAQHGFKILEKRYFLEDHSIFYAASKVDLHFNFSLDGKLLYSKNKTLFNNYTDYYKNLTSDLNVQIESSTQPVFLFGAHIFSQYLLAFGLREDLISGILDNDPGKQGKRLYGSDLVVFNPTKICEIENPVIILRAGAYNTEIRSQILEKINSTAVFI
jgi:Methyltransferase domain/C-methyltransferase C-terminal domain